jgi:hypothetical protein
MQRTRSSLERTSSANPQTSLVTPRHPGRPQALNPKDTLLDSQEVYAGVPVHFGLTHSTGSPASSLLAPPPVQQELDPNLISFDDFALFNAQLGMYMDTIMPPTTFGFQGYPLPDDLMQGVEGEREAANDSTHQGQWESGSSNTFVLPWQENSTQIIIPTAAQIPPSQDSAGTRMAISPLMDHGVDEEEEDDVDDSTYDPMEDPIHIGLITDKEAAELLDE